MLLLLAGRRAGRMRLCGRLTLHGPIEVHADAVSRFARILVGQREDERGSVAHGGAHFAGADRVRSLRLAEVHHVQGHAEVIVIGNRVAPENGGHLCARCVSRSGFVSVSSMEVFKALLFCEGALRF